MRWHVPTSRTSRKKSNATALSAFGAPSKARRCLQETEVYSKLYYNDRILPAVQRRLKTIKDHKGPIINVVKEVTKELWAVEEAEIRENVAAKMAEQVLDEGDNEGDMPRTPQQYQE